MDRAGLNIITSITLGGHRVDAWQRFGLYTPLGIVPGWRDYTVVHGSLDYARCLAMPSMLEPIESGSEIVVTCTTYDGKYNLRQPGLEPLFCRVFWKYHPEQLIPLNGTDMTCNITAMEEGITRFRLERANPNSVFDSHFYVESVVPVSVPLSWAEGGSGDGNGTVQAGTYGSAAIAFLRDAFNVSRPTGTEVEYQIAAGVDDWAEDGSGADEGEIHCSEDKLWIGRWDLACGVECFRRGGGGVWVLVEGRCVLSWNRVVCVGVDFRIIMAFLIGVLGVTLRWHGAGLVRVTGCLVLLYTGPICQPIVCLP